MFIFRENLIFKFSFSIKSKHKTTLHKVMGHIYYHGTSSLFLHSIEKHGLGGININEKFRLLELLNFFYTLSEYHLADDEKYKTIRCTTKAMVFQTSLLIEDGKYKGYHNFNHKHTYTSYSKFKAMAYAINTEYGSEILSRIIALYRLLKMKFTHIDIPSELNCIDIEKLETQKFFPLLISVNNVNIKLLQTEYGESIYKYLNQIQNMKQRYDNDTLFEKEQYYNFRLLKPISPSQLSFYKILHSGTIGRPDFRYTELKL